MLQTFGRNFTFQFGRSLKTHQKLIDEQDGSYIKRGLIRVLGTATKGSLLEIVELNGSCAIVLQIQLLEEVLIGHMVFLESDIHMPLS